MQHNASKVRTQMSNSSVAEIKHKDKGRIKLSFRRNAVLTVWEIRRQVGKAHWQDQDAGASHCLYPQEAESEQQVEPGYKGLLRHWALRPRVLQAAQTAPLAGNHEFKQVPVEDTAP